jgi:hypothetical protein
VYYWLKGVSLKTHCGSTEWMIPEIGAKCVQILERWAAPLRTRKKLAEDTAGLVNIRATGHGWCLASDAGCGGQGLYEPTRCLDCRNGVIDSSHVHVWESILAQQRELLVSAADCGPSGSRRIQRDLAHAEKVLGNLGIMIDEWDR